MYLVKSFICFLSALFLYPPSHVPQKSGPGYKQLFIRAEKLSNTARPSDKTDREALKNYLAVVGILSRSHADDHFLFKAYVSTGTFLQVLNRQKESAECFKKAIKLMPKLPDMKDSALFKPLVYCGNAYYRLDKTDSAALFYNRAEIIAEKYPKVRELERLYNTLGVIAYSSGNYSKSITYYNKAISTLTGQPAYDNLFLVTYQNNLASAYKKLHQYEKALHIYKRLLSFGIETDKLLHNIGSTYLAMGNSGDAIKYLLQVKYTDQKKLNDLGRAYFEKKDDANALKYLQQAVGLNNHANHDYKNTDYGITLKYLGDVWFEKGKTLKALSCYQQSVNNLIFNFHGNDIYQNPSTFTSVFNTIELLETLQAKAVAFKKLYGASHKIQDLEGSLQTYQVFYKLAGYVERVYDNDDARLLISNRKYTSHEQPIQICVQLFRLTGNRQYIDEAFSLDEQNKASTLALSLQESKLRAKSGIPPNLLQEESSLKQNITRLSLAAQDEKDNVKLSRLNGQLNELSISLLKVQEKINRETNFGRLKFPDQSVSIAALKKIIPSNGAILSYHVSDSHLIYFVITNDKFEFFDAAIGPEFYSSLAEFYTLAQSTDQNNRKRMNTLGPFFYNILVKPAEKYIGGKKNLMIIPDNELNYLPFELITDLNGQNLLTRFTLTYNYSCTILQNSATRSSNQLNGLAMAPFANSGADDQAGRKLNRLPASREEIVALAGSHFFDSQATKLQFVRSAHYFNIIHLATHAFADDRDPNKSFIAFYPRKADSAIDFKLYLPEVYNLKLYKTRLVVLSACESGVGALVKGEGLMSLSRAFSYAGCDNIITSMWKADDAATAYISGRLYAYLQKGYTIASALQQAKLDYLYDSHIAAAQKLPGYWAHFRLIGSFETTPGNYLWMVYVAAGLFLSLLILKKKGII